jgi:hypothetical protein
MLYSLSEVDAQLWVQTRHYISQVLRSLCPYYVQKHKSDLGRRRSRLVNTDNEEFVYDYPLFHGSGTAVATIVILCEQ